MFLVLVFRCGQDTVSLVYNWLASNVEQSRIPNVSPLWDKVWKGSLLFSCTRHRKVINLDEKYNWHNIDLTNQETTVWIKYSVTKVTSQQWELPLKKNISVNGCKYILWSRTLSRKHYITEDIVWMEKVNDWRTDDCNSNDIHMGNGHPCTNCTVAELEVSHLFLMNFFSRSRFIFCRDTLEASVLFHSHSQSVN